MPYSQPSAYAFVTQFLICLVVILRPIAAVDIISSSKLETCIRNGTQGANSTAISCKQKVVVVVSVDSGDSISSQDVQFTLNCVGSSTGQCPCPCNYASDASCGCRDLSSSLTVSLSKGPLWASYPLTYLQSFNYKPYETIVRPGAGKCKDGVFDEMPTCGWYYVGGQKVDDSQGFVCQCDSGQIWDTTFGANKERTRANLDCDFFSDPLDILLGRKPCSAHCLIMDPHWYGGYGLGEASLQFEIAASLAYAGASSSSSSSPETLTLSPSVPWALSAGKALGAKLLGDLAGYTQLPVLSERVLLIPHPRNGQSINDMFANRTEWMLLDRSKISFDGGECDKVGTSFTAFRYQAGACVRAPQVCLTNQLRDILEAERARVASGRAPLYLLSQYSHGLNSSLRTFAGGLLSFALPVSGIRSSLVQLEAEADSMRLVVNTSPGKILGARVCQFAEVACGGFQASATRGFLHAFIANRGTLAAAYTLTVSNCSVNVRPVEAQRVALAAGQNGTITPFVVYVEDDAAVAARHCWLTMLDAQGGVTDQVIVKFYTNATAYEEWPSGGLLGNGTGPGTQEIKDCSNVCSNRFDFVCAIRNDCWGNVGRFFGLTLGLASAAALLFLALKLGWLASLLQLLSCCGGSSSNSSRKNRQRKYEFEDEHTSYDGDSKRKGARRAEAGAAARHSSGSGQHTRRQQRTDVDDLQAEQQQRRQSSAGRPRGTSRSSRASKAEIYVDDDDDEQRYFEEAAGNGRGSSLYGSAKKTDKSGGYNMHSTSGGSSGSPGRWIKSGVWDDSAAGGAAGRSPDGRAPAAHRSSSRRSSSSAGGRPRATAAGYFLDEEGREFEEELDAAAENFRAADDEDDEYAQHWRQAPQQQRAAAMQQQLPPRAYSSSPGGLGPLPHSKASMRQSRSATQLSELVSSAHRASEFLDGYSSEHAAEHHEQQHEGLHRSSKNSSPRAPSRWPGGVMHRDSASGYRHSQSPGRQGSSQAQDMQQPSRAANAPGARLAAKSSSAAAATAAAAAAAAAGKLQQQHQRGSRTGRGFEDGQQQAEYDDDEEHGHSLKAEQRAAADLARSSRDSISSLDAAVAAAVAVNPKPRHSRGSRHDREAATLAEAELEYSQQEQQHEEQRWPSARHSRASAASLTRRHSAGSSQQQQQQQQQQDVKSVAAGAAAAAARQAGHRQQKAQQDRFFAPYDDAAIADPDPDTEDEQPELHFNTGAESFEGPGELDMSAYRHGARQQQQQHQHLSRQQSLQRQQQRQQPLQRQSRQQSQVGNWPEQQQQQQQTPRASQVPAQMLQPAASSPGGSSPAPWQQQQLQQLPQQPQSPQRLAPSPVGGPLSTASRPLLAPYDGSHHSSHAGRGTASTPGAAAFSSKRTTASDSGSSIGRSRQQQQQLGPETLAGQRQRPSLAMPSPAARSPGFVRSAAAALSGSGGRSPSTDRQQQQQQQQQLRQMLTSNPLYDGVDD